MVTDSKKTLFTRLDFIKIGKREFKKRKEVFEMEEQDSLSRGETNKRPALSKQESRLEKLTSELIYSKDKIQQREAERAVIVRLKDETNKRPALSKQESRLEKSTSELIYSKDKIQQREEEAERAAIARFMYEETMRNVVFGNRNLSAKLAQAEKEVALANSRQKEDLEQKRETEVFLSKMTKEERREFDNFVSQSGMVGEHAILGAMFAKANGIALIFRPINPSAAQKLELFYYLGKTLGTKGKSSYFPPIDGEIPFIAALSYLGERKKDESAEDVEKRLKRINEFQKKNESAISDPQKRLEEELEELKTKGIVAAKDQVLELNKSSLETKIDKKIEYGRMKYQLLFVVDKNGQPVWDKEKNGPLFVINLDKEENFLKLNSHGKPSDIYEMPEEYSVQKVEILGYRQFKAENDQIVEIAPRGIAPDYDLLTAGAKRPFPFVNSKEVGGVKINVQNEQGEVVESAKIYGIISKEQMFEILKNGTEVQKSMLKEQLLQEVLEDERDRFSYAPYDKKVGIVTQTQNVVTTIQYADFQGASSHGPDSGNPFPEEFNQASYSVLLPNGQGKILKNENEICHFINEQINLGYPMDINPKWGWKRDEKSGDFYVPAPGQKDKFDWRAIEGELEKLGARVKRSSVSSNESTKASSTSLEEYYKMQKAIYEKYVEFLRLEQKPKLVFSKDQDAALEAEFEARGLLKEKEDYKNLKDEICEMHRIDRVQKSIDAFNEIIKLEKEFVDKYKEASIAGTACDIREHRIKELQEILDKSKLKKQPNTAFHPKEASQLQVFSQDKLFNSKQ